MDERELSEREGEGGREEREGVRSKARRKGKGREGRGERERQRAKREREGKGGKERWVRRK